MLDRYNTHESAVDLSTKFHQNRSRTFGYEPLGRIGRSSPLCIRLCVPCAEDVKKRL